MTFTFMIQKIKKTILTDEYKDRKKKKETKYRGFHFNDDQIQTEEDSLRSKRFRVV